MIARLLTILFAGLILTLGGEAAALEIHVTADSSRYQRRYTPDKVVDGSIANSARWVSAGHRTVTDGSDPHWLVLEFDDPLEFDQVRLLSGYGNDSESALYDYTIDVDRDGRWVEVACASRNGSLNRTHSIAAVKTRRLRVNVRQGAIDDSFARIKEIRLLSHGRQVVPERIDCQRRYFAAPPIIGQEDEFCRRAYGIMLRGAAFAKDLYHDWPNEPRCGYLGWGGHGEKEILANIGMSHLYAMLISFGQYDAVVTGVSRDEALRRIEGVIRYCCHTHFSGSHACVDGDTWGGGWHDSSWSTVLAHTVWLVWPKLDEATQEMAARVIAAEANRFIDLTPPSGKINNTRAEENAWNTRATAIASVMFPEHPHAEQWRIASRRWMMNCLSVAADQEDPAIVDGRPVCEWASTENVHPDFTIENHGIVYPVYMWSSMVNLCQSAGYHIYARRDPPQAAFHHLRDVYDVYKRLQTWEGLPAYINGSDKFLHLQVVDIFLHSFFAQVLGDREAAHLEAVELEILERMQARFSDGRLYPVEEVGPWSRVNNLSFILGGSYLLHYVLQNDVEPIEVDRFERRISGVSYFPHGKFLLHRTPNKLVSFAWSKAHRIMGLAMPREGSWLVTPHPRGFTGVLLEEGRRTEPPWRIESLDFTTRDDSFLVQGQALRCDGKIRHSWTFHSLPDEVVVMSEKITAVDPVTLVRAETGTMGIGRELGSEDVQLRWDNRTRALSEIETSDHGLIEIPTNSLTVDERFTYTWSGQGVVTYLQHDQFTQVHGAPGGYGHLQDELSVRHVEGRRTFLPGQVIAEGELRVHFGQ